MFGSPAFQRATGNTVPTAATSKTVFAVQCPKHNIACVRRQVKKEGPNKGKFFFACPAEEKCFFKFEDEINPAQFQASNHELKHLVEFQICGAVQSTTVDTSASSSSAPDPSSDDNAEAAALSGQGSSATNTECLFVRLPIDGYMANKCAEVLKKYTGTVQLKSLTKQREFMMPYNNITYQKLTAELLAIPSVGVGHIPEKIPKIIKAFPTIDVTDTSSVDWSAFPEKIQQRLRPFQKQGINFGIQREGKMLLADEMGLGKTLQCIAMAYYYRKEWPLLIICPSSLRINWSKELEEWLLPHITSEDINIIMKGKDELKGNIVIVSYDLAVKLKDEIKERNFQVVVADECHYLKNWKAQRTQALIPIIQNAKRSIMITGTPALSRPNELYTQFRALCEGKCEFFTKNEFAHRYCDGKETAYGIDDKGSSNLMELNYLLGRTVMIRRLKDQVLTELPPKTRQIVYLTVKKKVVTEMKKGFKNIESCLQQLQKPGQLVQDVNNTTFQKNKEFMKMFQSTGLAKLEAAKEYLEDLLENGVKFVIFGHHKDVLNGIEDMVRKKKVDFIRIDGDTHPQHRAENVKKFRDDHNVKVAIMSIGAGGVGLTLCGGRSSCSNVVFLELFYTPGSLTQAEDRVHRIGQDKPVVVRYLIAPDTLDDRMWPMIQSKLEVVGETLDAKREVDESWQADEYYVERPAEEIEDEDMYEDDLTKLETARETARKMKREDEIEKMKEEHYDGSDVILDDEEEKPKSRKGKSPAKQSTPKTKVDDDVDPWDITTLKRKKPLTTVDKVWEMFANIKPGAIIPANLSQGRTGPITQAPTQAPASSSSASPSLKGKQKAVEMDEEEEEPVQPKPKATPARPARSPTTKASSLPSVPKTPPKADTSPIASLKADSASPSDKPAEKNYMSILSQFACDTSSPSRLRKPIKPTSQSQSTQSQTPTPAKVSPPKPAPVPVNPPATSSTPKKPLPKPVRPPPATSKPLAPTTSPLTLKKPLPKPVPPPSPKSIQKQSVSPAKKPLDLHPPEIEDSMAPASSSLTTQSPSADGDEVPATFTTQQTLDDSFDTSEVKKNLFGRPKETNNPSPSSAAKAKNRKRFRIDDDEDDEDGAVAADPAESNVEPASKKQRTNGDSQDLELMRKLREEEPLCFTQSQSALSSSLKTTQTSREVVDLDEIIEETPGFQNDEQLDLSEIADLME